MTNDPETCYLHSQILNFIFPNEFCKLLSLNYTSVILLYICLLRLSSSNSWFFTDLLFIDPHDPHPPPLRLKQRQKNQENLFFFRKIYFWLLTYFLYFSPAFPLIIVWLHLLNVFWDFPLPCILGILGSALSLAFQGHCSFFNLHLPASVLLFWNKASTYVLPYTQLWWCMIFQNWGHFLRKWKYNPRCINFDLGNKRKDCYSKWATRSHLITTVT